MASYLSQNNAKIEKAFNGLLSGYETSAENIMRSVLQGAVETALGLHDEAHHLHLEIGDTYGWMLVHDGRIVDIVTTQKGDDRGDTSSMLEAMAPRLPKKGWVGVVMAGMDTPNYFSIDYETGILIQTRQNAQTEFFRLARQIA